jgi:hypothetical protein
MGISLSQGGGKGEMSAEGTCWNLQRILSDRDYQAAEKIEMMKVVIDTYYQRKAPSCIGCVYWNDRGVQGHCEKQS